MFQLISLVFRFENWAISEKLPPFLHPFHYSPFKIPEISELVSFPHEDIVFSSIIYDVPIFVLGKLGEGRERGYEK